MLSRLGCLLFLFLPLCASAAPGRPPSAELRFLIDISGSMKKTDPQNLRAPLTRLLIDVAPENSKVGI